MEIRESNNPFMVTTTQQIGCAMEPKDFQSSRPYRPMDERVDIANKYDMSFLYSRESEQIGKGVEMSDNKLAKLYASAPSKSETYRMERGIASETSNPEEFKTVSVDAFQKTISMVKDDVSKVLASYNHDPKDQNPLYATTTNDFGIKKPTEATYTSERLPRKQGFSNSFNSQMPRDQGLNTTLTRSVVHTELDPSFV